MKFWRVTIPKIIRKTFVLDEDSIHGKKHRKNVKTIGRFLAKKTNADLKVVQLFACLHDIKRKNEDSDDGHGARASIFIDKLYQRKLLNITKEQLKQLMYACKHHSNSEAKSDDITIQTCWDADRLDLWRLNIEPEKELLYTDAAKENKSIEFAKQLNKK